jgi:hypothetical protein
LNVTAPLDGNGFGLAPDLLAASAVGPKRILAIEGGGVRGIFSLAVLERMETVLRRHSGRKDLILAEHFHMIAGTSVGAIIAACLAWGLPVRDVRLMFERELPKIFSGARWRERGLAKYRSGPLRGILENLFVEDDRTRTPAAFGTRKLKTWLLIVLRNLSTGSAWPLLNHPDCKYNRLLNDDGSINAASNLRIPLWQIVRASAAAPWYFEPERVEIESGGVMEFIDGGITAYNNPAIIAWLMATLPQFPLRWSGGVEKLTIVSVGTGRLRTHLALKPRRFLGRIFVASTVLTSVMEAASLEQDLMLRAIGRCVHGEPIDQELGSISGNQAAGSAFTYARYNRLFSDKDVQQACDACGVRFTLDAVALAPWLAAQGEAYAEEAVRIEHLL